MKTSSINQLTEKTLLPVKYNSLYIHVPFCKNICDYCALYSVVNNDTSVRLGYLNRIAGELNKNSENLTSLTSLFIGGGTPTQLSEEELQVLLSSVNTHTTRRLKAEFTVECNPGTVNPQKLKILKESGVNRLSFGAQSTTRKTRRTLGRRTSHQQLVNAIETARECGFENINIDLIYGIPGQELRDWEADLYAAIELKLPHYSAYSLILEEGTVLSGKYSEVNDELAVEMYETAGKVFRKSGLERYEISNYSQKGHQCRHNYDIWKGGTYLGLGPAACSFNGRQRWTQIRDLNKWLEGYPPEEDILDLEDRLAEVIAFGFRTVAGWQMKELKNLLGADSASLFSDIFYDLEKQGLITIDKKSIKPTENGLLFADSIAEAFL